VFFDRFKISDKYLSISNFPYPSFKRDMIQKYKTEKILNFVDVDRKTFFGGFTASIHLFFLPELVYMLTTLPPRSQYKEIAKYIISNS